MIRSSRIRFLTGAATFAAPLSVFLLSLIASTALATYALAQVVQPPVTQPPKTAPAKSTPAKSAPAKADTTKAKTLPVDGVAAIVGDQVVLISEVTAAALQRRSAGADVKTKDDLIKLETVVRDQMVEAELLVQKAKLEKIEVNEAELTRSVDDQEKNVRKQFKTDLEFRTALKESGMGTYEDWRKVQSDLLKRDNMQRDLIQKLKRDGKMTAVNVSEAEVTEAYESNRTRLPRKEARVGLRQIVMPTMPSEAARKRARFVVDSLRAELEKHPEDFELMAKKMSMDPSTKEVGGDLGWNRRGRMLPEFDRMMFALNPGVISPVVETSYGFHIIRVDRVQPAEVKARHILIGWTFDSLDNKRAAKRADSVAAAWRGGANFDTLSVKFHDNAAQEDKTIPEWPRDSLPVEYRNAVEGKKLHDILNPFSIPTNTPGVSKFVIAQITFLDEAGEYTLAEMRERIRTQLSEERSMRRLIDSLKKQTFISIRYDPAKSLADPPQ